MKIRSENKIKKHLKIHRWSRLERKKLGHILHIQWIQQTRIDQAWNHWHRSGFVKLESWIVLPYWTLLFLFYKMTQLCFTLQNQCDAHCVGNSRCTHYTWTPNQDQGICLLKTGPGFYLTMPRRDFLKTNYSRSYVYGVRTELPNLISACVFHIAFDD